MTFLDAGTSTADLDTGSSLSAVFRERFVAHFHEMSRLALGVAESCADDAVRAAAVLAGSLRSGGTIYACGNGGSAADAQHFAAELVGCMVQYRPALAAVSLTADTAVLTSLGNDFGFEEVFARQVRGLGRPGDALVAVSTSGRSPNVLRAVSVAREVGMAVVSLTGMGGDPEVLGTSDVWMRIGSPDTPHVQEMHTAVLHTLCLGVEQELLLHDGGDRGGR